MVNRLLVLQLRQAAVNSNLSMVLYCIQDADYDTVLEMIRLFTFEKLPFSEAFVAKNGGVIRSALREAFFSMGSVDDVTELVLVQFLTENEYESDEEEEEESEEESEEVDDSFLLEYEIGGLHLRVERHYENITVTCGSFVVAELTVYPGGIVDLEDFMWFERESKKEDYLAAKETAKAHGRTFGGVVMEAIKKSLRPGEALQVRPENNGWITKEGTDQKIDTGDVQRAAREMLAQGVEPKPKKFKDHVKEYVRKRYSQLHPRGERLFKDHLKGLAENGWYGAWLPSQRATDRDDIIDTKARVYKENV